MKMVWPVSRGVLALIAWALNKGVSLWISPVGLTKPLMPVFAARTRLRLFSTARNTVMAQE